MIAHDRRPLELAPPRRTSWYRLAGPPSRRPYHAAGPDWQRTGRAQCGANISRPAFASYGPPTNDNPHRPHDRRTCAHCLHLTNRQENTR